MSEVGGRANPLRATFVRVGRWLLAHAVVRVEEYAFDYVFYPFMLYQGGGALLAGGLALLGINAPHSPVAGYWIGLIVLTAASILINLTYVRAYDRLRTDWFGFETLKGAVGRIPPALAREPWRGATRYLVFGYLSVWHNPLFATLFMRRAVGVYAMTWADWRTFWFAIVVANLGWAGLVSGVVEGARRLLQMLG